MAVMPSMLPVEVIRLWWTWIATSPLIRRVVWSSRSRVRLMAPSDEFSTGTTPKSAVPASAARNTSSIEAHGRPSTALPNCW